MNKTVEEEFSTILDELVGTSNWMITKEQRNKFKKRISNALTSQRQTLRDEIGKLDTENQKGVVWDDYKAGYNKGLVDVLKVIDNN